MKVSQDQDWVRRMSALDDLIKPIADEPVDVNDPDWPSDDEIDPLAELGIVPEIEGLLTELVAAYAAGDESTRRTIRKSYRTFPSFAWAATLPADFTTADGLRAHLIHFSIIDQGPDPRDAKMRLEVILHKMKQAGVHARPILDEVAEMSSREEKCWGSTRDWLLRAG